MEVKRGVAWRRERGGRSDGWDEGWYFSASVGCNYRLVIWWFFSWFVDSSGTSIVVASHWKARCRKHTALHVIDLGLAWIRQEALTAKSRAEG